jgi:signal transduction histidine kinase
VATSTTKRASRTATGNGAAVVPAADLEPLLAALTASVCGERGIRLDARKTGIVGQLAGTLTTQLRAIAQVTTAVAQGDLTRSISVEARGEVEGLRDNINQMIGNLRETTEVNAQQDWLNTNVEPQAIADYVERAFRPIANQQELHLETILAPDLPATFATDEQRLQQILKNLLSNGLKFTETGGVTLTVSRADGDTRFQTESLRLAETVLRFDVADTGIGIPADQLKLIFEAFQQADGTTSRRFGGTGLGLSISREIARLLGGEIRARSTDGQGSTFTLYLPDRLPVHSPERLLDETALFLHRVESKLPAEKRRILEQLHSADEVLAMKGDREKSIAAGASVYVTKPVDTDQLLSLMRVWMYR